MPKEGALACERRKCIYLSYNLILEFIRLFTCYGSFIKYIFFSNRLMFKSVAQTAESLSQAWPKDFLSPSNQVSSQNEVILA